MISCENVEALARRAFSGALLVKPTRYGCEVTLPFLDSVNDWVSCHIVESPTGWKITDIGETINRIESYFGFDPESTPKRSEIYALVLKYGGLQVEDDEIFTVVEPKNEGSFAQALVGFANALERLNAMTFMSEPRVRPDFKGAVIDYLMHKEIMHEIDPVLEAPVLGSFRMDLRIGSREVVAATLYASSSTSARTVIEHRLVQFEQLRKVSRHPETTAIYDDESEVGRRPEFKLLEETVSIPPIAWSSRDQRIGELA